MNIDASGLSMDLGHGGGVMLYRCSFCKRGFSNAQALGGHMNIHRKDRAKLREFSDDNLFSLDITNTVVELDPEMKMVASSCEEVSTSKHDSVRSLPLFAETPSISKGKSLEKNRVELIHGELDLELRLGFQPHDAKIN